MQFRLKKLIENDYDNEKLLLLCDDLYEMTDFICEDYPKHKSWFYQKHLPATFVKGSGRDIIFACDENGKIYGTSFIKEDDTEKKDMYSFCKSRS